MRILGVLAVLLVLTACGAHQPAIRDVAKDAGCHGFSLDADVKGKAAVAHCTIGDDRFVTVVTFASKDEIGAWDDGDGPGDRITLVGDLWVVWVNNEDTAQKIAAATGAKIVD